MNSYALPQPEPTQRAAPWLWDYPLLRVPYIEIIVIVVLCVIANNDMKAEGEYAGLLAFFIVFPAMFGLVLLYALSFPLHFARVNNFAWDLIYIIPSAISLVGFLFGLDFYPFILALFIPSGLSLTLRRAIGLARWKRGHDPRVKRAAHSELS